MNFEDPMKWHFVKLNSCSNWAERLRSIYYDVQLGIVSTWYCCFCILIMRYSRILTCHSHYFLHVYSFTYLPSDPDCCGFYCLLVWTMPLHCSIPLWAGQEIAKCHISQSGCGWTKGERKENLNFNLPLPRQKDK